MTPGGEEDPHLDALLRSSECDALLVLAPSASDPDLAPFVRGAHLGVSALLVTPGERPLLAYTTAMEREEAAATGLALFPPEDSAWVRLLREGGEEHAVARLAALLARERLPSGARVAVAGRPPAGWTLAMARELAAGGWDVRSGRRLVRRWRKAKADWQLARIRQAARGAGEALRRVAATLAAAEPVGEGEALRLGGDPLTCGHLRRVVAEALARHELEQPEGNIVAAGADAAVPHSTSPPDRVLHAGETILIDLFPRHGGLFADCTRTFVVGDPAQATRDAFQVILKVLQEAHHEVEPGRPASELHAAASTRFEAAGYPTLNTDTQTTTGFVHTLGHGVGHELHEEPGFRAEPENGGRLEPGDVFTLEPGLYDPQAGWGIRLEDLVYLGPNGPENLTPLPYDLDPRAWG